MSIQEPEVIPGEVLSFDAKPWYLSRTIWGVLIAAVVVPLARRFGIDLAAADQAQLVDIALSLLAAGGGALAIYGRARAQQPIRPIRVTKRAAKMALALCLVVPLLGMMPACAARVADSPAQTVYGIQSDLTIGQHLAAGYIASPDAKPEVVAAVRRLEATAVEAVKAAQTAARAGNDPATPALIAAAANAVKAFKHYLEGAR